WSIWGSRRTTPWLGLPASPPYHHHDPSIGPIGRPDVAVADRPRAGSAAATAWGTCAVCFAHATPPPDGGSATAARGLAARRRGAACIEEIRQAAGGGCKSGASSRRPLVGLRPVATRYARYGLRPCRN